MLLGIKLRIIIIKKNDIAPEVLNLETIGKIPERKHPAGGRYN